MLKIGIKYIGLFLVFIMLMGESPFARLCQADENTIKIGVVAPLSGSRARLGAITRNATELAVKKLNASGGIKIGGKNYNVQVIYGDDEAKIETCVAATERLITKDKVVGIVGYIQSTPALAALSVAQRNRVPAISTIATTVKIHERVAEGYNKGEKQYVFQLSPTSYDRGETDAAVAHFYLKPKKLGALFQNTDLGRDLEVIIRRYFSDKDPNAKWVVVEYFDADQTEFYPELAKIMQAKPDVLFVSMSGVATRSFTKQFNEMGVKAVPVTDGSEFAEPSFIKEFPGMLEGWITNIVWTGDVPLTDLTKPFTASYLEAYGTKPGYIEAQQYEGMLAMFDAIKKAGSFNPEEIRDALEKIETTGVTSIIKFDPKDHRIKRSLTIAQVQEDRHVVIWPLHAAQEKFILRSR